MHRTRQPLCLSNLIDGSQIMLDQAGLAQPRAGAMQVPVAAEVSGAHLAIRAFPAGMVIASELDRAQEQLGELI